ncbi:hypothetical protein SAMN05518683_11841 [Salibacterium halotolerans]|uniref:Uncharacterized protein n=1 Tax=Salibacterium halotolerans TaxID=1884432 RepID=A0A1I5W1U0_9BACI|nr:hypothetical protein SAMN05518683_11841 [Salibacterium halotolerans]
MFYSQENVLLLHQSEERVNVYYNGNPRPFSLPKIGPRPPYFCYPRYEPYYPVI